MGKNLIFEDIKAKIGSVVTNLTRFLEGDNEDKTLLNEDKTLRKTISKMCPSLRCHLCFYYERIYRTYYRETVLPSLKNTHGKELLEKLYQRMINHKIMVSSLSEIFEDLNKFLADGSYMRSKKMSRSLPLQVLRDRRNRGTVIQNFEDLAMFSFREYLLLEINPESRVAVVNMIMEEREGVAIDSDLLKKVLDIYMQSGIGTVQVYEEHFEDFFLQQTASYYSHKASSWIQEYSCPEYMMKCEESLEKEKERVTRYLHSSTEPKLVEIMQNQLLFLGAKQFLDKGQSGCGALLRDDKKDDLSRMYRLYHAIPQVLEPVADVFRLHIATEGSVLIKEAEDSATSGIVEEQVLVRKIIDLHDKYMAYVTDCFQNHTLFHKALKEAFEIFCNKKVAGKPSAELLATFLYNLFKKAANDKSNDDSALESTIYNVVKLIVYISDRDLFAELYRKKLARWLLSGQSGGGGHEMLILKLKKQFGNLFTKKMETMVNDMELTKDIQRLYMGVAKPEVDFTATVLTLSSWPSYKTSPEPNLPVEMVKCTKAFDPFYKSITKSRKLNWAYSLGKCHVTGRFDAGSIELVVSTYQAAVLCVFNNAERLTFNEIIEQVKLDHEDLARVLHSLSCADYKILKKEPASKTISKTDSFEFNSKFTNKKQRIKVPLPTLDEPLIDKVVDEVVKDRPSAIEACLVKIMKEKKVLQFRQLIAECVERLSHLFKPEIKQIKKRIEKLMEKDYLIRDIDDANSFKYVA
ncbi:unnamed protein product [Brassica rapa]|uniref:Cullin family profile domain-containing protein n=2 Tax=Brassica campestris TaxID=3711 RepID=A0A8D9D1V4_BRACM|nr:unnamed protein product [Brassica rapa]